MELDVSPSEKCLLMAYALHGNYDGSSAFPGPQILAKLVNVKVRQVKSLQAKMKREGYLVREGQRGRVSCYRIELPSTMQPAARMEVGTVQSTAPSTVQPAAPYRDVKPKTLIPSTTTPLPPEQLIKELQELVPTFDSFAVSNLWISCRNRVGDCSAEEVMYFVRKKWPLCQEMKNGVSEGLSGHWVPVIKNRVGFLLSSVPKMVDRQSIDLYRKLKAQKKTVQPVTNAGIERPKPATPETQLYLRDHLDPWKEICTRLSINQHTYNTWIKPARFYDVSGSVLRIHVPTEEFKYIRQKFGNEIWRVMVELKMPFTDVEFVVHPDQVLKAAQR